MTVAEKLQAMALIQLRVQLFGAAQTLRGQNLADFWALIDDINAIRPVSGETDTPPPSTPITADTITDEQIRELRGESPPLPLLALCSQALAPERDGCTRRYHARARCAELINARAQAVQP